MCFKQSWCSLILTISCHDCRAKYRIYLKSNHWDFTNVFFLLNVLHEFSENITSGVNSIKGYNTLWLKIIRKLINWERPLCVTISFNLCEFLIENTSHVLKINVGDVWVHFHLSKYVWNRNSLLYYFRTNSVIYIRIALSEWVDLMRLY